MVYPQPDLLHPSAEIEKRKHKLKRVIASPNSFFMDVKCPGCYQITTVFSHASSVVLCGGCSTVLCQPTGELRGHTADVRCVARGHHDGRNVIYSGSRDRTVRVWTETHSSTQIAPSFDSIELLAHEHFVGAVLALPPSDTLPLGGVASGSNDKCVVVWSLADPSAPALRLLGHTETVSALSLTADGCIVSGSWDKTARVWRHGECALILQGHQSAVWAVLGLPTGHILTASADTTIRLWRGTETIQIFKGHTDAVRALVAVPGIGFASVSNDGTIRMWNIAGACVKAIHVHDSYAYSLALAPGGEFVSCGEDRQVRISSSSDGSIVQSIVHPKPVWSVCVLANGDIVSGCADDVVRVFSRDPARFATPSTIALFDEQVAATLIPSSNAQDQLPLDQLPTSDALLQPGARDGQTKIIRNGMIKEAHKWSEADYRWIKIGDLVDDGSGSGGGGGGGKVDYLGKSYDKVFDVEFGGVRYKLPFNNGDNPYTAAQQFIWDNELEQMFLQEIAEFIMKQSQSVVIERELAGGYTGADNTDPYTGVRRDGFTVGSNNNSSNSRSLNAGAPKQPYQVEGAYTGAQNVDPFTGGSAGKASSSSAAASPLLPVTVALNFNAQSWEQFEKKVWEFNEELRMAPADNNLSVTLAIDAQQIKDIHSLVAMLLDTKLYHASRISANDVKLVELLLRWPMGKNFVGLDLLRVVILHPSSAVVLLQQQSLVSRILTLFAAASSSIPTQILCLRCLVNLTSSPHYQSYMLDGAVMQQIFDCVAGCGASDNANVRLSWATLLLNYSILFNRTGNFEGKALVLSVLCDYLASARAREEKDVEAVFRVLVAFGTCIHNDAASASLAESLLFSSSSFDFNAFAAIFPLGGDKIRVAVREIVAILNKHNK